MEEKNSAIEKHEHLEFDGFLFTDQRKRAFYEKIFFDEDEDQEILTIGSFVDILISAETNNKKVVKCNVGEILAIFTNFEGEKFVEVRWLFSFSELLDHEFKRKFF